MLWKDIKVYAIIILTLSLQSWSSPFLQSSSDVSLLQVLHLRPSSKPEHGSGGTAFKITFSTNSADNHVECEASDISTSIYLHSVLPCTHTMQLVREYYVNNLPECYVALYGRNYVKSSCNFIQMFYVVITYI